MGVYASMYEEQDKKRGSNDYVKSFEDISIDKGTFSNFIDITSQRFNLSMKENGTWGEGIITEKYNNENLEKFNEFVNETNYENGDNYNTLRDKLGIYNEMSYTEYNDIKQWLKEANIADIPEKTRNNDYYKKIEAVRDIESFIEGNPQSKIMTKENIIQNARKDVELERRKFDARYNAQSSIVGNLVGDMGAAMTDPINIATLFVPQVKAAQGASALTKAFNIGKQTAILEIGAESINQITATMPYRKEVLGDEYTTLDAAGAVITTGLGAFMIGGSLSLLADGGKYLLKGKNENSVNDIITEQSRTEYETNPENFDADLIDSMNSVIDNGNKANILKDEEFIQTHMNALDEAAFNISFGKSNDVRITTTEMRTKSFNKILNNFDSKTNLDKFKLAFGDKAFKYLQDNTSKVRNLIKEKGIDRALNDIDIELRGAEKIEVVKQEASVAPREIPNFEKKINNQIVKEGYNKETVDDFNHVLNEVEAIVKDVEGADELVNDLKTGIIDSKKEIDKLTKEQEGLDNFIGCIIGTGAK